MPAVVAILGALFTTIESVDVVTQTPFVIWYCRILVPVTAVLNVANGELELVITPLPEMTLHAFAPIDEFPDRAAVGEVIQMV